MAMITTPSTSEGGDPHGSQELLPLLYDKLRRLESTSDAWAACNVVFACVLRANALVDMRRLVPLAEAAAPYYLFGAHVRGAALYRAGSYAEAVRSFETAAKAYQPCAWESGFVAMSRQRLARSEETRNSLAEADRWIQKANQPAGDDLSGARAAWGGWSDRVVYSLVLREARAVVVGGAKQNNKEGQIPVRREESRLPVSGEIRRLVPP